MHIRSLANQLRARLPKPLWKKPEKFERIRNFESNLGRTAINRVLDSLRREEMFEPSGVDAEVKDVNRFATDGSLTGEGEFWDDIRSYLSQEQFSELSNCVSIVV